MNYGIGNVKAKSGVSNTMLTTTTDATENSGTYTLDLTYLSETPKVNDYVVYVNSGNLTTLYQVSAVGSTNATIEKIGDIGGGGGGKQLYQHNIRLAQQTQVTEYNLYCTIISDRATAYDYASLKSYLQEQVPQSYGIVLSGKAYFQNDNVVGKFATRIYYSTNQNDIRMEFLNTQWSLEYKQLDGTITDRVKPL